MQTLPITTSQPTQSSAQTLTATDNGGDPSAELFNAVLARQIANSAATDGATPPAVFSAGKVDALLVAAEDKSVKLQDPVADVTSGLTADMLSALLPATPGTNGEIKDKGSNPKAAAPDVSAGVLPDGILAALLPGSFAVAAQGDSTVATPQPAGNSGKAQPSTELQALTEFQTKPAISRTQDTLTPMPLIVNGHVTQGGAFSAKLADAMGESTANPVQLSSAAQPDDAARLAQSNAMAAPPAIIVPNGPAQLAVDTPVGRNEWGGEFNQKITWLATQHEQTAELHLNPPQLGPLNVVLHVSGDQATALFTSSHAAVRDAVEQALPKLREMLADNGITLGNATVSDQSPRDQQPSDYRQASGTSSGRNADIVPLSGIQPDTTAWPVRRQLGMVDTFV